ncbi:MAG: U3 snoRNP protein [Sclerophora amabilis]|nr:MAG: U3 snoRNP protein [Sclerophora amabilis]
MALTSLPPPQTLTDPQHQPTADLHSSSQSALASTLTTSPQTFLQPPPGLYSAALVLAKRYLDPLAASVHQNQLDRQQTIRRKRKRSEATEYDEPDLLRINRLHLDGFSTEQIWEQGRRILDAAREELELNLDKIPERANKSEISTSPPSDGNTRRNGLKMVRFDEDGFELSESEDADGGVSIGDEVSSEDGVDGYGSEDHIDDENAAMQEDGYEDIAQSEDGLDKEDPEDESPGTFTQDPNGLNDGFFSIDDFNRQTDFLEHQDAAGNPDDGAASDEEEIDWDADPTTMTVIAKARPRSGRNADASLDDDGSEVEEEEEEDGPTFGNADLAAPEGDSEDDMEGETLGDKGLSSLNGMDNTNDIYYKDYFAPPPRKAGKGARPSKHTRDLIAQQAKTDGLDMEPDGGVQRTIDAVRRDIFEDDVSADDDASDNAMAQLDPSDPKGRRSNHERRQAKIMEEIRKLEAANVGKRKWTLSGEARASDRPLNSLLEEDLDFERTGKPIPVITAEVSEDIEELVKRRILAQDFDEVVRRRPDSLATDAVTSDVRRGRRPELDDNKAQQSLAELYEAEHMRRVDPEGHKDKRAEKLEKEHAEIAALWADVSGKLDALSSWHYRPAAPQVSVNVVADVPTIAMEDARPTAAVGSSGADMGANSMLAPQEIYAPGKEKSTGEVVSKTAAPVARAEMTREEKLRRRRREKERLRKKLGGKVIRAGGDGKGARERQDVVGALTKGGVKVIGKKGDVRDVEGKKVRGQNVTKGGGGFKL